MRKGVQEFFAQFSLFYPSHFERFHLLIVILELRIIESVFLEDLLKG